MKSSAYSLSIDAPLWITPPFLKENLEPPFYEFSKILNPINNRGWSHFASPIRIFSLMLCLTHYCMLCLMNRSSITSGFQATDTNGECCFDFFVTVLTNCS